MEELEEILIQSDIGVSVSTHIIDALRDKIRVDKLTDSSEVLEALKNIIIEMLHKDYNESPDNSLLMNGEISIGTDGKTQPLVILFVGVNGVGKTTTIGKLARRYRELDKKVMMIAGDTFRAAAIDQLAVWADRAEAILIKQQSGSDPSAVIYDGLTSAQHRKIDIVLIDTAGRFHTKVNLMNELSKMRRTICKVIPEAPHETLLVVDASTGQNAINQTKLFNEATQLTGLVLTKLDGTAKGGIVIGIKHELNVPVKLIGIGEKIEDLRDFDSEEFVEALFS
jgi:fused signal recognition particle receptor